MYDHFKSKLIDAIQRYTVGDPSLATTSIGPLSRLDLLLNLRRQVQESISKGALVAYGNTKDLHNQPSEKKGLFFHPMILEHVDSDMPAYDEELFGPVFTLFRVEGENEAVSIGKTHP